MAFSRDLLRGSIDLMVLSELAREPRYGYQILAALRDQSDGRILMKAGTLYPVLHRLERDGCLRTWWEDAARDRKWYALTDKGRARLERETREWLDYSACVSRLLAHVIGALHAPRAAQPAPETP